MKLNFNTNLVVPTLFAAAGLAIALCTQKTTCAAHKQFQNNHPQIEQAARALFGAATGAFSAIAGTAIVQNVQNGNVSATVKTISSTILTKVDQVSNYFFKKAA